MFTLIPKPLYHCCYDAKTKKKKKKVKKKRKRKRQRKEKKKTKEKTSWFLVMNPLRLRNPLSLKTPFFPPDRLCGELQLPAKPTLPSSAKG
ncbi:hypothetical protein CEXT_217581 [Caerostris extrusa]|uniref:Uncharacterized protein n=1 Tax=Caerostris extrusa TaxID=172846 RepID=A0AAV4NHF8_CAEEX|nr:hypothetical protein CEXT_217581 [Caerostris extrusa]